MMQIFAHGGYSAKYPENTIEAYIAALKLNPDYLEMDVSVVDGKVYFYHPNKLFGDGVHMEGEKLPPNECEFAFVFEEIIKHRKETKFFFDIKSPDLKDIVTVVNKAITILASEDILVGARNTGIAEKLSMELDIELMALSATCEDYQNYRKLGIKKYRIWEKDLSIELVNRIQNQDMEVIVTLGEKGSDKITRTAGSTTRRKLNEVIELKVDGVLINDLGLVIEK